MPYVPAATVEALVGDDQLSTLLRGALCRGVRTIASPVADLTGTTYEVLLPQDIHAAEPVAVSLRSTRITEALEIR